MRAIISVSILLANLLLLGTSSPSTSSGPHESHHPQQPHHHHHRPLADESFRRLESGENSDEMVNQCCKREEHFKTIGFGADGTELRVDVGACRQVCNKASLRPLKREQFDKYLNKYPHMDPVQIFLALQSRLSNSNGNNENNDEEEDLSLNEDDSQLSRTSLNLNEVPTSSSSCLGKSTCHPILHKREKHFGLHGNYYEVDVVESCECLQLTQRCGRISRHLRFHVDTPYETVVDVGECSGPCGQSDGSCRPIRNKTVTLEGPNGPQCLQTIQECECAQGCYRIKEFYKVHDYTEAFGARTLNNNDTTSSSSNEDDEENMVPNTETIDTSEQITKMIDIGRCGGSCDTQGEDSTRTTSKCLIWSGDKTRCLSSLYGGHSYNPSLSCSPTKFMTHTYTDRKGRKQQLYSIVSCGCH